MLKKISDFIEKMEEWFAINWWLPYTVLFSLAGLILWQMSKN